MGKDKESKGYLGVSAEEMTFNNEQYTIKSKKAQ